MSDHNQNDDQQQPGAVPPQPPHPSVPGAHPSLPAPGGQNAQAAPGPQPDSDPIFFSALFDLSFRHFITLKFAKVIFIILIVLAGLGWLGTIIAGFAAHPGIGLLAMLFGWIGPFIMLIVYRVGLEVAVALIRTAQNTSLLVNRG